MNTVTASQPGSLKKAWEQGLKVGQLLSLLARNTTSEIPPAFVRSLKRWEMNGTEARVKIPTVLTGHPARSPGRVTQI